MPVLDGKVALITGGTGALGTVVCSAFIAAGARIVATYVVDAELARFEAAVPAERRETAKVELTSRAALDALVAGIVGRHGRLDVLLNGAGGFAPGTVVETAEAELDRLLAMNLKTAFLCTQAVLPTMI